MTTNFGQTVEVVSDDVITELGLNENGAAHKWDVRPFYIFEKNGFFHVEGHFPVGMWIGNMHTTNTFSEIEDAVEFAKTANKKIFPNGEYVRFDDCYKTPREVVKFDLDAVEVFSNQSRRELIRTI